LHHPASGHANIVKRPRINHPAGADLTIACIHYRLSSAALDPINADSLPQHHARFGGDSVQRRLLHRLRGDSRQNHSIQRPVQKRARRALHLKASQAAALEPAQAMIRRSREHPVTRVWGESSGFNDQRTNTPSGPGHGARQRQPGQPGAKNDKIKAFRHDVLEKRAGMRRMGGAERVFHNMCLARSH